MHLPRASLVLAALLPTALAGSGRGALTKHRLHVLAKEAGLKYFGSATDSPGQRERAGLEAAYPQYDAIMWESGEFGQTTPTNGMKWSYTEPEQGVFNFTEGEIVASKASEADYYLRCHTLLWNLQLSEWVEAQEWTPAALREVVVNHITNVVGHWKGRCYSWDVVNEAFNEDGTFKETIWYNTLGEDYIKLAFQTAAKVDPKVKLYLNDYTFESPSPKTEAAQRLVKKLKAAGVRIDGVGLQSHLFAESHPTLDQHIDAIKGFTSLGVEVALTELDVSLEMPANAANLAQQREAYKNIVGACVQVKGCIGITLWDFYDPFSWIPYVLPTRGAAHLWFADFTHHPAYDGVVEALTNKTNHGKGPCTRTAY